MADTGNDNDYGMAIASYPASDAHGQAAMLLVESLIHGLLARSVITVDDALEIVDVAADVKAEVGIEMGDTPATLARSLAMLEAIRGSLARDGRE